MTINTGGAALSIARWFAHEFGPLRVVGRDHREPAVLPERDLGLLLETKDFGIEDAVLGANFVLDPNSTVHGLVLIFLVQLSAWFFLSTWFLYQLIEANFGIFGAAANGGGVALLAFGH
jgi:hypothetical protein